MPVKKSVGTAPSPHDIPNFKLADAVAIKAWVAGMADEDQQTRSARWVVAILGRLASSSYCPGDPMATAFNEGKRYVATTINFFINTSIDDLRKKAGDEPEPSEQG